MYPARTTYHLAHTLADYKACHAFFRAEAQHPTCKAENGEFPEYVTEKIQSPTVIARRNAQVIGVAASRMAPRWGLVGNPIHVAYDIKNHVPTLLRLLQRYLAALAKVGETHISFVVPNWKPSVPKIFEKLYGARLFRQALNGRYNIYIIEL